MEKVSTLYTFFVSQIFQHLNFNWDGVFWIEPPSERTARAHYKITVERMCVPTYIIKEELSTGAESVSALLGRSREPAWVEAAAPEGCCAGGAFLLRLPMAVSHLQSTAICLRLLASSTYSPRIHAHTHTHPKDDPEARPDHGGK